MQAQIEGAKKKIKNTSANEFLNNNAQNCSLFISSADLASIQQEAKNSVDAKLEGEEGLIAQITKLGSKHDKDIAALQTKLDNELAASLTEETTTVTAATQKRDNAKETARNNYDNLITGEEGLKSQLITELKGIYNKYTSTINSKINESKAEQGLKTKNFQESTKNALLKIYELSNDSAVNMDLSQLQGGAVPEVVPEPVTSPVSAEANEKALQRVEKLQLSELEVDASSLNKILEDLKNDENKVKISKKDSAQWKNAVADLQSQQNEYDSSINTLRDMITANNEFLNETALGLKVELDTQKSSLDELFTNYKEYVAQFDTTLDIDLKELLDNKNDEIKSVIDKFFTNVRQLQKTRNETVDQADKEFSKSESAAQAKRTKDDKKSNKDKVSNEKTTTNEFNKQKKELENNKKDIETYKVPIDLTVPVPAKYFKTGNMLTGSGSYIDANVIQIIYQSSMTGGSGSAFKLDNGKSVLFKNTCLTDTSTTTSMTGGASSQTVPLTYHL